MCECVCEIERVREERESERNISICAAEVNAVCLESLSWCSLEKH